MIYFLHVLVLFGGLYYINSLSLRVIIMPILLLYLFGKSLTSKVKLNYEILALFILGMIILLIHLSNNSLGMLSEGRNIRNFSISVLSIVFSMFAFKHSSFDLDKLINILFYTLIPFATLHLLLILFTPFPWVVIEIIFNIPYELSHLYTRIFIPMGTPPQLSFVSSCLLIYFLTTNKSVNYFKVFALGLIIILCGSNSSFVSLGIVLIFHILYISIKEGNRSIRALILITPLILLITTFLYIFFIRDFSNVQESMLRHIMLRSQSFLIYIGLPIEQKLFGIGLGNSPNYIEGSYSFMFTLTYLLESGLIGLTFVILYYLAVLIFSMRSQNYLIFIYVLFASNFYQLNTDLTFFTIPFIALAALRQNKEKDDTY